MSETKQTAALEQSGLMSDPKAAAGKQNPNQTAAPNPNVYVHTFSKPLSWRGRKYKELTFRWDMLTGADHLRIENEMRIQGKPLVLPEYSGDYLQGMAVLACTERDEEGKRVLETPALSAIPLRDFIKICDQARNFLRLAESSPETEDSGSENDA